MSKSKNVLIVGLNAIVQQQASRWLGPKPHWKIMELFYEGLRSYRFGAIQVYPGIGRTFCDYTLDNALEIIPLNDSPYARVGRIKEAPRIYARLLRAIASSDYVYIRFPSWVGLAAWRCVRWLDKPYWISLHGDWEQILGMYEYSANTALERIYYRTSRLYVQRSLRNIMAHARSTFFIGQSLCQRFVQKNVPSIAYHDTTHLATDVWELRRICAKQELTLLFVGEISKAKGVDILVGAATTLAKQGYRLRLIFVGRGPELDMLQQQQISNVMIELKGWVSQGEALDRLFLEADALVLPSLTEGVPRVIVEAMVRATPVIATTVGDIPDLLGDGRRGWLVEPGDADSLARAIEEFVASEHTRMDRVAEATQYVKNHDKVYWKRVIRLALEKVDSGLVWTETR